MNETTLNLTVTIGADEETLHDIQHKLPGTTNRLVAVVKETLRAEGVSNNFEVECHSSQIVTRYQGGVGLSEEAWGEIDVAAKPFDPDWDFATDWNLRIMKYQGELLCSD